MSNFDNYPEHRSLANLGDTHHAAGRPEAAQRAWRRAVDILDEFGRAAADEIRAKLSRCGKHQP